MVTGRHLVPASWRDIVLYSAIGLITLLGFHEALREKSDRRYVNHIAWEIVNQADAHDNTARVMVLRDYLLAHVSYQGLSQQGRPFFRDSAAHTLRSGKGYCGEVTRAFINMAEAVGVHAQRINLWGPSPHVVAEAELTPGNRVLVDVQNPPRIRGLRRLDEVMATGQFTDYYTVNLRRLRITWLVSRVRIEMHGLTYWTEHPHALKAFLWFSLGFILLIACNLRRAARSYLRRARWVKISGPPTPPQPKTESLQDVARTRQSAAAAAPSRRS